MRVPFGVMLAALAGMSSAACQNHSTEQAAPSAEAAASATAQPPAAGDEGGAPSVTDAAANPDAEAVETEEDERVTDELQFHHRHHHQGLTGFVLMAVETLGIAPDQEAAVDAIRKDFRLKMKPLREANAAVLTLLADGTAAGTIDTAKVDAGVAKAAAASAAVQAATPDLLNRLHDVLRPEQRSALVDKVDAHWGAWREANSSGQDAGSDHHAGGRRLAHLAKDIGLTSDQVDKFRANLEAGRDAGKPFDPTVVEAYVKAFDSAFVADKFDAKTLPASSSESSRIVSFGAARMARVYEALLPVLTADQRTKVADMLRQRAEPKEKP
jgi:Spy/CpxP family protein refolding chaperone